MKYLMTTWNTKPGRHQLLLENKTPTKTTHIRGYGFGVTFSSRCYAWSRNYTATPALVKFSGPSVSC